MPDQLYRIVQRPIKDDSDYRVYQGASADAFVGVLEPVESDNADTIESDTVPYHNFPDYDWIR